MRCASVAEVVVKTPTNSIDVMPRAGAATNSDGASVARAAAPNASIEWKLTDLLFNQRYLLISGGLMPIVFGGFAWARTHQQWLAWWAVASAIVLVARLIVDGGYPRGNDRPARPSAWRRRFLVGAWVSGAVWGAGGAAAIATCDPFTQAMMVTLLITFVFGSAARNGTYPSAAIGAALLADVPLILALIAKCDTFYVVSATLMTSGIVSAASVTRHLYAQTVNLLELQERQAALVDEIGRSNRDLAAANEKLVLMARTDGLTGVLNRRSFDEAFATELDAARRDGSTLSVLLLDIDVFKHYNDHYGHQAGDECLKRVASAADAIVRRPRDAFARYGGEEFVAILPQTDLAGAAKIAGDICTAVAGLRIDHDDTLAGVVTVSIGVAACNVDPLDGSSACGLDALRRADEALYRAKHRGRNRIEVAPDAFRALSPQLQTT